MARVYLNTSTARPCLRAGTRQSLRYVGRRLLKVTLDVLLGVVNDVPCATSGQPNWRSPGKRLGSPRSPLLRERGPWWVFANRSLAPYFAAVALGFSGAGIQLRSVLRWPTVK
jgi:hypothetical protein